MCAFFRSLFSYIIAEGLVSSNSKSNSKSKSHSLPSPPPDSISPPPTLVALFYVLLAIHFRSVVGTTKCDDDEKYSGEEHKKMRSDLVKFSRGLLRSYSSSNNDSNNIDKLFNPPPTSSLLIMGSEFLDAESKNISGDCLHLLRVFEKRRGHPNTNSNLLEIEVAIARGHLSRKEIPAYTCTMLGILDIPNLTRLEVGRVHSALGKGLLSCGVDGWKERFELARVEFEEGGEVGVLEVSHYYTLTINNMNYIKLTIRYTVQIDVNKGLEAFANKNYGNATSIFSKVSAAAGLLKEEKELQVTAVQNMSISALYSKDVPLAVANIEKLIFDNVDCMTNEVICNLATLYDLLEAGGKKSELKKIGDSWGLSDVKVESYRL